MTFTSPLWLIGLLPWMGVAVYLLWGRRRRQDVPFLALWRETIPSEKIRRRFAPPPVALALAVLVMLLAVLGSAGPVLRLPTGSGGRSITLIVDRGLTMSAKAGASYRFRQQAAALWPPLLEAFGNATVRLYTTPSTSNPQDAFLTDVSDYVGLIDKTKPTALDTREELKRLIRRQLAKTRDPVIVVSDANLDSDDPRLVQVAPGSPIRNVGIVSLAVRTSPRAQVMMRLRNDSELKSAPLVIETGGQQVARTVDLPPRGQEQNVFVDVPAIGSLVSAELKVDDDLPTDDRAWQLMTGWPKIDSAVPVGDLQRLIDAYRSIRPAGEASQTVKVGNDIGALGSSPGVAIHWQFGSDGPGNAPVTRVMPHPITDGIADWASLDLPLGTGESMPEGWTPILWAGDRPAVAVRDTPSRQVWVALDTGRWSHLPQYVVFWTAVFDWAGQGGEVEPNLPLTDWTPAWRQAANDPDHEPGQWPGLFQNADGVRRVFTAANATRAQAAPSSPPTNWQARLTSAAALDRSGGGRDLGPIMFILAIGCVGGAAMTWRRHGGRTLTALTSALTVNRGGRPGTQRGASGRA